MRYRGTLWLVWRIGMRTDTEIRQEGMKALIQMLGMVDAERFVATLSRERFDYTEWRKTHLPEMDVEALSKIAARYAEDRTDDSS